MDTTRVKAILDNLRETVEKSNNIVNILFLLVSDILVDITTKTQDILSNVSKLSEQESWTEIVCGRKTITTAGTAERLVENLTLAKKIIIVAETDNTGVISVGGTTVRANLSDRQGVPLFAGDSITLSVKGDLRGIWLDTTVDGDGVTYTWFR